jgi:multicomponent Na+:H+ antiporter subunit C
MNAAELYMMVSALIFVMGFHGLIHARRLLRKILSMNVMGGGVFLFFISVAGRNENAAPDPVPHAMVLTGIVVAVSATAFALALAGRIHAESGVSTLDQDPPPDKE